jgi:hypothetical protein
MTYFKELDIISVVASILGNCQGSPFVDVLRLREYFPPQILSPSAPRIAPKFTPF